MEIIETNLSYLKNSFTTDDILAMLNPEILGFSPNLMTIRGEGILLRTLSSKKLKKYIKKNIHDRLFSFSVAESVSNICSFGIYDSGGHQQPPRNLRWCNVANYSPPLTKFLDHPGFVNAYAGDSEFLLRQEQRYPSTLKALGKIPKYAKKKFDFSTFSWVIDIQKNYGRTQVLTNALVAASCKMWFSKQFYEMYVPKTRIMEYPAAYQITELANEVVCVQLYEDPFESENRDNYNKLKHFREWMEYDGLFLKDTKNRLYSE